MSNYGGAVMAGCTSWTLSDSPAINFGTPRCRESLEYCYTGFFILAGEVDQFCFP
jgi:hypothetical protein